MNKNIPLVSVLMPVYNGGEHLREAIDSILGQTFRDFEFLIVNDGSTDDSESIIKSYKDERIKLVCNPKRIGLAASLNKGIAISRGKFVARMDADDISFPERLGKQSSYMKTHTEVDVCGSSIKLFSGAIWRYPRTDNEIKCTLLFNNALAHPTVVVNRDHFVANNLYYDKTFKHSQDYDLWARALKNTCFHNLEEPLVCYRVNKGEIRKHYSKSGQKYPAMVRRMQLNLLGINSQNSIKIHEGISVDKNVTAKIPLGVVGNHLRLLIERNNKYKIYPRGEFDKTIFKKWLSAVKNSIVNKFKS
jgi:glycosyltransferase involved in cell wall biosynthesis